MKKYLNIIDMLNFPTSLIRTLPPELAHKITINLLKIRSKFTFKEIKDHYMLSQHLWGLDFNNPIGLAAGFDKNVDVVAPLLKLGFGFVEAGTITPKPQKGNEKPRVFRLQQDQAIINHLGFNNLGMNSAAKKLKKLNLNILTPGVVGINIGINSDSKDPINDYCVVLEKLAPLAHYVAINISSPNTPGLRDLQSRGRIENLFKSLNNIKNQHNHLSSKALLLKIAPDLKEEQLRDIALMSLAQGVDGIIISNSTTDRPSSLISKYRKEIGGLSGKPLFIQSTLLLKKMYNLTNGQIPLIGVGGVSNGIECYEKIKSGASLVQLYTSLIFQGPRIVQDIKEELLLCLKTDGFKNVKEAIGIDV